MSDVYVCGMGAVSPAGWGVDALRNAVQANEPTALKEVVHPGKTRLDIRQVPPPPQRFPYLSHPRLRRSSPIAQYSIASALEALGDDAPLVQKGEIKLGVILAAMSGCVNYSRRFYDETLKDPATASPLVFPETVFNAPASHIGAFLSSTALNYTIVGDPGTFLQGLVLAAQWLDEEKVDACLVIGSEEGDWLTSTAFRLFIRKMILSDGAGALYLRRESKKGWPVKLASITDSFLFGSRQSRREAARKMYENLGNGQNTVCVDGLQGLARMDRDEESALSDWRQSRISPKKIVGESLMAAAAWQCILGVERIRAGENEAAIIPVVGCNQQAIGARFEFSAT